MYDSTLAPQVTSIDVGNTPSVTGPKQKLHRFTLLTRNTMQTTQSMPLVQVLHAFASAKHTFTAILKSGDPGEPSVGRLTNISGNPDFLRYTADELQAMNNVFDLLDAAWRDKHGSELNEIIVALTSGPYEFLCKQMRCRLVMKNGGTKHVMLHFFRVSAEDVFVKFERDASRHHPGGSTISSGSEGWNGSDDLGASVWSSDGSGSDNLDLVQYLPRVLHVDDSKLCHVMVKTMLSSLACHVEFMSSGEEFLEYALSDIGSTRFDVVILDNNMGGIDGFEALRQARSQNYTGCVIMCSGDQENLESFLEHADVVVNKHGLHKRDFQAAFEKVGWAQ